MRSVLVTRPQPAADEFAEKLRRDGYQAHIAPMMEYVGVKADLGVMSECQALVFTSAQAVQLFAAQSAVRDRPALAVGDATADTARQLGFLFVYSAKGNSVDVANLIRNEAPKMGLKKVLHLCSADTPDDIGPAVAGLGIEVVRRPIYKAELVSGIPEAAVSAIRDGKVDTVLLFSARTAENFVRLLVKEGLRDSSAKMEAICISDTVAGALRGLPWRAIRVAKKPKMESVLEVLRDQAVSAEAMSERRARKDRRVHAATRDTGGNIDSPAYKGPERRVMSRRAHEQQQKKKIVQEKVRFLNRSVLTFAFMFIAIVGGGTFIMAPEYFAFNQRVAFLRAQQERERLPPRYGVAPQQAQESSGDWSLAGLLNELKNKLDGGTEPVVDTVNQLAGATMDALRNPGHSDLSQILRNAMNMRKTQGGEQAVARSMESVHAIMASSQNARTEDINRSLETARAQDPTLNAMLGDVKKEDLAAAGMLLVLGEFRSNVSASRPYAEDLALLKRFAGNNPAVNRALQRLAPYAESGVMNRAALQDELKGLAGDIVTAELQGKDISVQDAARARLDRLSRAAQATDVKGRTPDAVVARAQILLDQGNVNGAIRELQSLNGPSAEAAQPWVNNAGAYMAVDRSSDDLTEGFVESFAKDSNMSVQGLVDTIKETLFGSSAAYVSPGLTRGKGRGNVLAPTAGSIP